jgi:hypothetical protein
MRRAAKPARSKLARQLDDAFAGCDRWVVVSVRRRRRPEAAIRDLRIAR